MSTLQDSEYFQNQETTREPIKTRRRASYTESCAAIGAVAGFCVSIPLMVGGFVNELNITNPHLDYFRQMYIHWDWPKAQTQLEIVAGLTAIGLAIDIGKKFLR
jgi:hypothetical protein